MNQSVELPIWLLVLVLLFAAVTFASHFLFPSVRWFFRKRAERVIAKLNTRLARPIEPFKLATRYDMIQRIIYDPKVTEAVVEHAETENMPESVAFEQARKYAREIVPSFSATLYFSVGMRVAKWVSRAFYKIRLGEFDREQLSKIDPDATVIFVMNHRSNMDYVLVTHLVSQASTLSYAVGEWARIWPLSSIIKMLGAYFIRRKSRGNLYRRVLARYVQMATDNGVTQAFFPEGGLSLTGAVAEPKLGLLSYIVSDRDSNGRDVIFVPVAINYDHVIEDRRLIAAGKAGTRRFGMPINKVIRVVFRHMLLRMTGGFEKLGIASVSFGSPLSLEDYAQGKTGDLTEDLATDLMARVRRVVPVTPVPLVATVLAKISDPILVSDLTTKVAAQIEILKAAGSPVPIADAAEAVKAGLAVINRRKLIECEDDTVTLGPDAPDVLAYYAASIAHHFDAGAA
jgi:glycerol-3-phosphate O-acyltransferase